MQFNRMLKKLVFLLAILVTQAGLTGKLYALNCGQVKQLVAVYLKVHFTFHTFDDELARRTLDSFIKNWDPGKMYFLDSDIEQFNQKYASKLDDMILANPPNCSALDEIAGVYSKRYAQWEKVINRLIEAKHDFNVDEYMNIDRKNIPFAKTTEEIEERWRQKIKFQLLQLKTTIDDYSQVKSKLSKRYQLALKRHNELTSKDVYETFLNAFASSLDPHSEYMSAEQLEDFRIYTKLSLEGIGAVLRSDDGFTKIQSLVPGGAAAKSGKVQVDDKIIAVAQGAEAPVDVIDMDLREVVKLIRGPRNTEVRLTIVRDDGGKTVKDIVPIIREKVELQDKAASSQIVPVDIKEKSGQKITYKIGIIDLPSFYMDFEGRQANEANFTSSSADVKRELNKLSKQGIDGLVIDLRSNGGGSLDEAIAVAGLFFDKGPVVQIKSMEGSIFVQSDKDGQTYYNGPLLVVINRLSASASEIFAGAIQDYDRGLIVGDTHTFGKGTVQNLNDITEKLGAVKVTISKFYRPSGGSTQLRGVESDIVLPDIIDEYEIGEKHYDYALPWEKIAAADFKKAYKASQYVRPLVETSKARIDRDILFKEITDGIKKYKDNTQDRYRVSLKWKKEEVDKIKEKKKDDDKKKKKGSDPEEEDGKLSLNEDAYLQETLRIAGDYLQLINKKPLGQVSLPTIKVTPIAVATTKKVEVDPEKAKQDPSKSPLVQQQNKTTINNTNKEPEKKTTTSPDSAGAATEK